MACIHTVSSTGDYDVTFSVSEVNVLEAIETFLAVLNYFGDGGRIEIYSRNGELVNYLEV